MKQKTKTYYLALSRKGKLLVFEGEKVKSWYEASGRTIVGKVETEMGLEELRDSMTISHDEEYALLIRDQKEILRILQNVSGILEERQRVITETVVLNLSVPSRE